MLAHTPQQCDPCHNRQLSEVECRDGSLLEPLLTARLSSPSRLQCRRSTCRCVLFDMVASAGLVGMELDSLHFEQSLTVSLFKAVQCQHCPVAMHEDLPQRIISFSVAMLTNFSSPIAEGFGSVRLRGSFQRQSRPLGAGETFGPIRLQSELSHHRFGAFFPKQLRAPFSQQHVAAFRCDILRASGAAWPSLLRHHEPDLKLSRVQPADRASVARTCAITGACSTAASDPGAAESARTILRCL